MTLCLSFPAHAQTYTPGSAGYLYENCKRTLEHSTTLEQAHNTYCGAFIEGFTMGLLSVGNAEIPIPPESDPCYRDKARAYNHINDRFCTHLPKLNPTSAKAGDMIRAVADYIEKWAGYNRSRLDQPAAMLLATLFQPGPFCEAAQNAPFSPLKINPALENITWPQLLGSATLVSMAEKNRRCADDIARAKNSPVAFNATPCGAEIMGFMAGTRSTAHLQENRVSATAPACAKPLKRLYDSFDVSQTMCLHDKTSPLLVAKIFTKNYGLIAGKPGSWAQSGVFDAGALGAAGYETIYRGFLCRNETELQSSKTSLTPAP